MCSWLPSWPRAMSHMAFCAMFAFFLAVVPANAFDCTPCSAADSSGTVHYPTPCPHKPTSGQFASIIDGLPQGTTIEIPIEIIALSLSSVTPGGSLEGEVVAFDGQVHMPMTGTGSLSGFSRDVSMSAMGEVETAPRTPGNPVQSFDTDMFRLQGQLPPGDPDFDLLRVTAGTGMGLPSPGHTTLTRSSGGDWSVDSFFDITYRIDFVGHPGGPLGGMSGSTTGTIRVYQGCPGWMPGEIHKMHYPQPPDESGWDVFATYPNFLADDWQCTETGPVKDIHFWGSWMHGQVGRIKAFHLQVYSDVPKGPNVPYSHPGNLLWQGVFADFAMTPITPLFMEGWYDPGGGTSLPDDHNEYWQYDFIFGQTEWFEQVAGTIYWLSVSAELEPDPVLYQWGWKSSTVHFNDDAVYLMSITAGTCVAQDAGGTAVVPADCPISSDEMMWIVDGLPPEVTIESHPTLQVSNAVESPGGSLGGTTSQWDGQLTLEMSGTGTLAGFHRTIQLPPGPCMSSNGPRSPGASPQDFPTDLTQMQGQITGDPDFDLLRITAGSDFGMPSPGHTTLTRLPGGDWNVDSFFDITYRIDFVGHPGGPLGGMSGSTTGTIRMQQGTPVLPEWHDLYEPLAFTQSLDLAFVITNGPGATTGACCGPNGNCFVATSLDCTSQNGTYLGDGTLCLGDNDGDGIDDACGAAIVRGACCWPNGTCGVTTQDKCLSGGGMYLGDGSVCLGDNDGDGHDDACEAPAKRGACCLPDGTCGVVTQDKCVTHGGTYLGDGTPCLGDLDGNGHDDACERPNPDFKWEQLPDLNPTGMDVYASVGSGLPPYVLADDFLCTVTGPITEIHVFGSWRLDKLPFGDPRQVSFNLSIHSDIPKGPTGEYSRPGELLCFLQNVDFKVKPFGVELQEGWMVPPSHWSPWPNGDRVCWEYTFYLPPNTCFQEGTAANPIVYWLDVQATPAEQGTQFGWKSAATHWNDDATWAIGNDVSGANLAWGELFYPPSHQFGGQSVDLAFKIFGHNGTPQTGACCWPDGSCSIVTQSECEHSATGLIGTYKGDGTICAGDNNGNGVDDACEQVLPTGACCYTGAAGPACINTTQASCILTYSGTWYPGQNCATFNCPQQPPLGACCYPDAAGVMHCTSSTTHKECVKVYGGTWYLGQTCATIDCPTPQPMGACCYGDPASPSCVNTTQDLCKSQFNGVWYAGQNCATFDCPTTIPLGACCFKEPGTTLQVCANTTQADCVQLYGGTWYAGQNCATFDCPNQPPLGACCYDGAAGPTCVDATQADCHAQYGGTWHAGTTCATYQCVVSHDLGACCFLTTAGVYGCASTTQLDCNAVYGGTWYVGQNCATFQCPTPVPTGACCYGTPPQCATTTEDQCKSSYGGTWHAGQSCTDFQCVSSCCVGRVGDANGIGTYPNEVTISDIQLLVTAKFISSLPCEQNLHCLTEADVNQSGGASPTCSDITISDIQTLVNHLFIAGPPNAPLKLCF